MTIQKLVSLNCVEPYACSVRARIHNAFTQRSDLRKMFSWPISSRILTRTTMFWDLQRTFDGLRIKFGSSGNQIGSH